MAQAQVSKARHITNSNGLNMGFPFGCFRIAAACGLDPE